MANTGNKFEINLISSLNTDTINQNVYQYGDKTAPFNEHTGIERDGGATNIYQTEEMFAGNGSRFTTENGQDISIELSSNTDIANVKVDGNIIGQISAYGLETKLDILGVDDVMLTADNSYLTLNLSGVTTTIREYSLADNSLLNTRTQSFVNLVPFAPFFTSINFVRYQPVHFTDNQEFALKYGDQLIILKETNTIITITSTNGSTSALGGNAIYCAASYNNTIVVAGQNSRVASFDGVNWKNYDGSGLGSGIHNAGTLIGSGKNINCIFYSPTFGLVFGGDSGRLGSYDGYNFKNYDGSGTGSGINNNSTVISTSAIRSITTYNSGTMLIVAGDNGRMGNYTVANGWINYNASGHNSTIVACDNLLNGEIIHTAQEFEGTLALAGGQGYIGSVAPGGLGISTAQTISGTLGTAGATMYTTTVPDFDTSLVAISDNTGGGSWIGGKGTKVTKSLDGITWNPLNTVNSQIVITNSQFYINDPITVGSRAMYLISGNRFCIIHDGLFGVGTDGINFSTASKVVNTYQGMIGKDMNDASFWFNTTILQSQWSSRYSNPTYNVVCQADIDPTYNTILTTKYRTINAGISWTANPSYFKAADGVNWGNVVHLTGDNTLQPCGTKYVGNNTWIIIANGHVNGGFWRSTNSGTTFGTSTSLGTFQPTAIATDKNGFIIIVGSNGTNGQFITSSNYGASWTSPANLTGWTTQPVLGVVLIGNTIIVTGANGVYVNSSDKGASFATLSTMTGWTTQEGYIANYTPFNGSIYLAGIDSATDTPIVISNTNNTSYAWKDYDSTGSGSQTLYDNGVNMGAGNTIYCSTLFAGFTPCVVFAGASGRVCNYSSLGFTKYDGTGAAQTPYNSGTALAAVILSLINDSELNRLYIAGNTGRVASFDASHGWTNYDGTGYNGGVFNSTFLGANNISFGLLPDFNQDYIWYFTASGAANSINKLTNTAVQFYTLSTGGLLVNILEGITTNGYIYVYKYETNGLYLINPVNNNLDTSYILNNSTNALQKLNARYAFPQISNGFTRHILTETPRFDGTNQYSVSQVGYLDFNNFTLAQTYPNLGSTFTGINNISLNNSTVGWNYADFVYALTASPGNLFNFLSPNPIQNTSLFSNTQGNTDTLINSYGKLTNFAGLPPTVPFEIRILSQGAVQGINSVQNGLSVAVIDNNGNDCLGTLLTNPTEIDEQYTPHIVGDNTVLYKYKNIFYIVKVSKNSKNPIQKLSSRVYKLNTISPENIYDSETKSLNLGSMDYNGRMFFSNTNAPDAGTPTSAVSRIASSYSNSYDPGDKLITMALSPAVNSSNFNIIGYRIPSFNFANKGYSVDTYYEDAYLFSTLNSGAKTTLESIEPLYTTIPTLPPQIGGIYTLNVINTVNSTIFLNQNNLGYDGYELGNNLDLDFITFILFGQIYLFDGKWIYQADFNGNILNPNLNKLAAAEGLIYIATTPTYAYFLSSFDNSLYTYNGGRSLDKFKRFNMQETINFGQYSVKDNALALDTTTTIMYIRDGIITKNYKTASQIADTLRYYDTTLGLIVGNNLGRWQYTYFPTNTSTVVPLKIQTVYYGMDNNQRSIFRSLIITVYDKSKQPFSLKLTHNAFDPDNWYNQVTNYTMTSSDFNQFGYCRLRFQPKNQRNLGNSFTLETDSKLLIMEMACIYEDEENAIVSGNKSR